MGKMITYKGVKPSMQTLHGWVWEAMTGHSGWRASCWEDAEFKDGLHWTAADYNAAVAKGINPLTINRVLPVLNLINGNYIRAQKDIIAKGRTKQDHEISQVMSEAIAYVVDQNDGALLQRNAFDTQITVGYNHVFVGYNSDPRKERVLLQETPWYNCWWDPYGSPWLKTHSCRYFFQAAWKDIDDVKMAFPQFANDLDEEYRALCDVSTAMFMTDIGTEIENYKDFLSAGQWVNTTRRRVRPVEMWYTTVVPTWFAIMPNGRVIDMDKLPMQEQYAVVQASQEVLQASVKKMNVTTFVGNLQLQDVPTPFPHDEFPYVPYISYLDRFGFPYGVPRNVKEQNMEVNKRRSMGLALLGSKRVIAEEGAAEDLNVLYEEANSINGMIVVKKGKLNAVTIEDLTSLAAPQISMMQQSENEIQEIVGATDEAMGATTPAQSGISLDKKRSMASTMTLNLLENAYTSQKRMGEQIMSLVQSSWTAEKVMRVVDRLSGVEKFVEVNKRIDDGYGNITVHNDLTQSRFDLQVATAEMTDTMREKNMDLLFSAINKAPTEAVAPLLNVAFELSDIPEKERILSQVREATGMGPVDETLTSDQRKAKQMSDQAQKQAMAAEDRQRAQRLQDLTAEKLMAMSKKALDEGEAAKMLAKAQQQKVDQDGFAAGYEIIQKRKEGDTKK
ncbi:MAG: hypothetical protein M0R68_03995 [Bacteroidetes bacterium]|nr:hypothetical protein [Bacteroidota bacterium]